MNIQIPIAFSIYFLALIFIGYIFSKKIKDSSTFILGGRSTNYWVTAIALQASDMSHWLFLGFPAVVCATGLIRIWEILGIVLFMFLSWHFVAPRIRVETEKLGALTLFSYFEKRFSDTSGKIRILTSIICVFFLTFYISSGLVALGRLFENALGLTYKIGVFVGVGITLTYTLIGGFLAVAWCDFFQGLFALAMIVLVPTLALYSAGGWLAITQAAAQKGVSLSFFPSNNSTYTSIGQILSLLLIWGPGYFGQPHLISFFMGIKNPKNIKYAKFIGLSWQLITLSSSALIGLAGLAYFQNCNEMIYVNLTKALFSPAFAGIILCAIIAATLSTLDSYILTSGATIAQDLYKKIIKQKASSKQVLFVSRLCSFLVSIAALAIAFNENNKIYDIIKYGWSGMGSAFGPLVLASLFSNRINRHGALAGIITGATIAGIWPQLNTSIPAIIPGFITSYISIFLTSFITKNNKSAYDFTKS